MVLLSRWVVEAAIEKAVPADVLATALFARFRSREAHTLGLSAKSCCRPCASDSEGTLNRVRSVYVRVRPFGRLCPCCPSVSRKGRDPSDSDEEFIRMIAGPTAGPSAASFSQPRRGPPERAA